MRILPAASRLATMLLLRLSPNTFSEPAPGINVAVVAMVVVLSELLSAHMRVGERCVLEFHAEGDVQNNAELISMPKLAKNSATIRPPPQSIAIIPSVSTSGRGAETREIVLASAAGPAPGERLDLLAIVTSVSLTRTCAVAGPPELAAPRYGSISGKDNRVTVVICRTA